MYLFLRMALEHDPQRIVFTRGAEYVSLHAAAMLIRDGFPAPILLGDPDAVRAAADGHGFDIGAAQILDPGADAAGFGEMLVNTGRADAVASDVAEEILGELRPREAEVLRMRAGMYDGRTHTLEEVAAHMGVTRERIRAIEDSTLRTLLRRRRPSRADKIRDFYK